MTIKDLYDRGHTLPKSELLDLAKAQIAVIKRGSQYDEYGVKNYVDNVFQVFAVADDDPSYSEYELYNACGANHRKRDFNGFVEQCRQAQRIEFLDIIADHFHEEVPSVRLAVSAFAVIVCVWDGRINPSERAALGTIMNV